MSERGERKGEEMGKNPEEERGEGGSSGEEELLDLETYYANPATRNKAGAVEVDLEDEILTNLEEVMEEASNDATSVASSSLKDLPNQSDSLNLVEDDDDIQEITEIPRREKMVARKRTCPPPDLIPIQNLAPKPSKPKQKLFGELKFMADFDPTKSSRNQQKKKKRYHPIDGRLIQYADDYDDCDCLRPKCPGCHYPCRSCGDPRCGLDCRQHRKWVYDSVEIEGTNQEFKNPLSNTFSSV